jgi:hypothetical protein
MNLDYTSENLEIFNSEIENEIFVDFDINDNLTNLGYIALSAHEENHCDCGCDSLGDFFECQCDCTESEIFESLDLLSL